MNKTDNRRPGGWHFTSGGEVHLFYWKNDEMVAVCGVSSNDYIPSYANDRISCRKCQRVTKKDFPELEAYLENPTGVAPVVIESAATALESASTNSQLAEWAKTYGKSIIDQLKILQ